MTIRMMLAGLLLVPACAGTEPPDPVEDVRQSVSRDGIEYRAETQVLESFPVQLRTSVTVTNRSGSTVMLELPDGCAVLLRAYRDPAGGRPAWDQGQVAVCTMAIQEIRVAAGERRSFEGRSDAREILGDSLPDGSYRLTAVVRPKGTTVEIPAGQVQLGVPR
jgi:hypothetical protein